MSANWVSLRADGRHIGIGANETRFYRNAVALLWLDVEALPHQHDKAGWPAMHAAFAQAFRSRPRDEWVALAEGRECCIAPILSPGAGVVTSRGDVRFVVTEYGVADLLGKNIRQRARALISIAHPKFREELLEAAKERHYLFKYELPPRGNYPIDSEKRVRNVGAKKLILRPVRPNDDDKLSFFFYSLDETTIYKRYLHVVNRFTSKDVSEMVNIDYDKEMSLVLVVHERGFEPQIQGIAQFFEPEEDGFAETAFLISDAWQGQGLGTAMMERLMELAVQKGIKGFTATLQGANHSMLSLFHKTGCHVDARLDGDTYEVRMPFAVAAAPKEEPDPKEGVGV